MPEDVRQILKEKIGYIYQKEEKPTKEKVNWKEKMPHLTDEEVTIFEYFDDKWNEQGCKLWPETVDQMIEYDGKNYTRGSFMIEAKKRILNNS